LESGRIAFGFTPFPVDAEKKTGPHEAAGSAIAGTSAPMFHRFMASFAVAEKKNAVGDTIFPLILQRKYRDEIIPDYFRSEITKR